MRRTAAFLLVSLGLTAAGCAPRKTVPPAPRPALRYYVKPADDPALLQVTVVAENLGSDSLDFTFPIWLPGEFRPIEPGKWVEDVRVRDRSTVELPVRRLGANLWRVYPRRSPYFLVEYVLHPVRPDGFKRALISELTPEGGYFTGAVAFGYFKGLENYPLTLTFEFGARTPVVCSLEEDGPGRYHAPGAFELSQAGCAYGSRMRQQRTVVRGVPHRLVVVAPAEFEPDSLVSVVEDVAWSQAALFRFPAYREYTFFVHFVDPIGAGMGGAPLFQGSAYYLPAIRSERIRGSGIPYLVAHQLFHAWNLWRFPPEELSRPALHRPVDTRSLWLVEGLADHYSRVALARSRVLARSEVYAEIARNVRALEEDPAAAAANLETAGVAAARTDDRDPLRTLALKAPLAALALDVELRRGSANGFGTDSLLGWLAGGGGGPRVAPYDSVVGWLLSVGGPPVRALYAQSIAGSQPLRYERILGEAGLELVTREVEELNLGASLLADGRGGLVFGEVEPAGVGGIMGLRPGDRLISVNRQPVTPDNLLPLLAVVADLRSRLRYGKPFRVGVERDGVRRELVGTLRPWRRELRVLVEDEDAPAAEIAVREAIFSGNRSQALGS